MNAIPLWLLILGAIIGAFIFSWALVGVAAVAALFKTPQDTFDVTITEKNDKESNTY